jgi:putative membrane protein
MRTCSPTVLLLGAALLSLAACGSGEPAATGASEAGKPSQADLNFIGRATFYNDEQIAFSRLAETKATDSAMRDLAARIIQTDTGMNRRLAAVAGNEGLPLPSGMDQQHQARFAQLQSMNGPAFNRAWLDQALPDQTMAIETFQAEADNSKYPPFRDLAGQSLPALLENLQATQQLSTSR